MIYLGYIRTELQANWLNDLSWLLLSVFRWHLILAEDFEPLVKAESALLNVGWTLAFYKKKLMILLYASFKSLGAKSLLHHFPAVLLNIMLSLIMREKVPAICLPSHSHLIRLIEVTVVDLWRNNLSFSTLASVTFGRHKHTL